jgi:DNA-binding HxlR family transcriptional regulator
LFHHRWNVPVIAALHLGGGARVVQLCHSIGCGREALRATLDALAAAGVVMKNPGYGHPLRPEYVLTPAGRRIAPACVRFHRATSQLDSLAVAYRKWSAPLLLALDNGYSRFNAIQQALGEITPRALTQALRALCDHDLVVRSVEDGHPPRSAYLLSTRGQRLARAIAGIDSVVV